MNIYKIIIFTIIGHLFAGRCGPGGHQHPNPDH